MEDNFWHQKWEQNDIPFHESQANPSLVAHIHELRLPENSRVFVPLCGKTLDIHWLLSKGHRVAGAELSTIAIEQLFAELHLEPTVSPIGPMVRYSAPNLDIFAGDLFNLSAEMLGGVDAIYDRAALVALPEQVRVRYAAHLMGITNTAPQLLICYVYDQNVMEGPPFSISDEEVQKHYGDAYSLKCLASTEVAGGLKGKCPAKEHVWHLLK
jgi:thiopurine S-methyltransferase